MSLSAAVLALAATLFGVFAGLAASPASAVGAGPDRSAVTGEVLRFEGARSGDPESAVLIYAWSFGDGATAKGRIVQHAYRAPGSYVLRIERRDAAGRIHHDTATVTVRPPPNAPPVARAGGDITTMVGVPVTLDAGGSRDSDGAILAYRWQIDGVSRDGPRMSHVFHSAGVREAVFEVEDESGARARDRLRITVAPAPNAPPSADAGPDRVVAPGEVVRFDGRRSRDADGPLLGWHWSFGDGAEARGPIAHHAYAAPGRYRARLTVEDASLRPNGRATDDLVVVVNAPPIAEAGADRRTRATQQSFDAAASRDLDGRLIRYRWDFGDGATAEGRTATHEFRRFGHHLVTLTVTDDSGAGNAVAADRLVVIIDPPPQAEAGPMRRAAPGEGLTFDAGRTGGAGLVAVWRFGDGTRAVGRVVEKRFAQPGRHAVRLSIYAAEGGPALTTDETAVIVNAPPVARAGPDLRTAPGGPVQLDAGASFDPDGTIHRYVWRIGEDIRRSPSPTLTHSFDAPGRHRIDLMVIDDSGAPNDTAHDSIVVSVNAAPVADGGPDRVLADRVARFDATASHDPDGDPLTYRWEFGDGTAGEGARVGHVYPGPGRYVARLQVDDGTGFANAVARDETIVTVNGAPVAEAELNLAVCAGNVVTLDGGGSVDPDGNALTHRWQFDDGVVLAGPKARRTFEVPGDFGAILLVDDGAGVANSAARDRVFVSVDPRPRAEAGPDRQICAGEVIAFDGTGSTDLDGAVNRFRWRFGDGTTADGARPSHAYAEPGRYRVSLTIEGDPLPRCDNTDLDWSTITVSPAPRVAVSGPGAAAVGETVTFVADASALPAGAEVLAYAWSFGDDARAEGRVVTHRFEEPGDHVVSLSMASGGPRAACATAEATHGITVNAPPVAVIDAPALAVAHRAVRLDGTASRDPEGVLTAYRWTLSDGTRLSGPAPEHVFEAPGLYEVSLEVVDASGQVNAVAGAAARIEVVAPPSFRVAGPEVSCVGEPVVFRADFGGSGAAEADARLAWDLGDGTLSEFGPVTHVYRAPGRYTVTASLDAMIRGAPVAREASRTHSVNAAPVAVAGPDIAACPGAAVDFDGSRSFDADGDPLAATWDFGDGGMAEGLAVTHSYAAPGLYPALLRVEDGAAARCSAATAPVKVRVNARPVAEAGETVAAALIDGLAEVTLDGGASRDPEGRPLRHVWSVGGGDRIEGRRASLRFDRPGRYLARLHVSDGTGLACGVSSDTVEIQVVQ